MNTWEQFSREVRAREPDLLKGLSRYQDPILVMGCQRSGTTIVSRILTSTDALVDFRFGRDDELDAALLLSETVPYKPEGRYCFQTTYLNAHYVNLFDRLGDVKLVWVLRNPYSVVYSMTHNWKRFALNELFDNCGREYAEANGLRGVGKSRMPGFGIKPLYKAMFSYNARIRQSLELRERATDATFLAVNYEDIIQEKDKYLKMIFDFVGIEYRPEYAQSLRSNSMKKVKKLSGRERAEIERYCSGEYEFVKSELGL